MMNIARFIFSRVFSACLVLLLSITGCGSSRAAVQFSASFESGNLPVVKPLDQQGLSWELALHNDNNDPNLPDSFRTWWYVRADNVPTQQPLHLEFTRFGFAYYFVPIYSYDQKNWQYFDEKEVTLAPGCNVSQPETCRLIVNKQFSQSRVWLARTFPYTTSDLSAFLNLISASPYAQITTIGWSPYFRGALQLVTLADNRAAAKQTIWIHARTHAAETGPSFLLEGLIRAVLADDALGKSLREQYVFKIVPMHNVDGIIMGNYRVNATSLNLELQWKYAAGDPYLDPNAAVENRVLNSRGMVPALFNQTAPVALALNLHSSNAEPDTAAFFYPHFGSDPAKYTTAQQNLWRKQLGFIQKVAGYYDGRIERPPLDGGAVFLNNFYPETWWWANRQDATTAITLETTYGRAGFNHWITENDLRNLGVAVAKAINDMNKPQAQGAQSSINDMSMFRLPFKPELYTEARD